MVRCASPGTRLRLLEVGSGTGRYLPGFTERETRLYDAETLRRAISETDAFLDSRLRTLPWRVTTSLARLLEQARAFHYSTLRLYSPTELEEALEVFEDCVARRFGARKVIADNDHQLVLASRRADRVMSRRRSERGRPRRQRGPETSS
ncbi:MAG: hypothetical protein ACE5HQ_13360 [Gemmatimonadota bacterium]